MRTVQERGIPADLQWQGQWKSQIFLPGWAHKPSFLAAIELLLWSIFL